MFLSAGVWQSGVGEIFKHARAIAEALSDDCAIGGDKYKCRIAGDVVVHRHT